MADDDDVGRAANGYFAHQHRMPMRGIEDLSKELPSPALGTVSLDFPLPPPPRRARRSSSAAATGASAGVPLVPVDPALCASMIDDMTTKRPSLMSPIRVALPRPAGKRTSSMASLDLPPPADRDRDSDKDLAEAHRDRDRSVPAAGDETAARRRSSRLQSDPAPPASAPAAAPAPMAIAKPSTGSPAGQQQTNPSPMGSTPEQPGTNRNWKKLFEEARKLKQMAQKQKHRDSYFLAAVKFMEVALIMQQVGDTGKAAQTYTQTAPLFIDASKQFGKDLKFKTALCHVCTAICYLHGFQLSQTLAKRMRAEFSALLKQKVTADMQGKQIGAVVAGSSGSKTVKEAADELLKRQDNIGQAFEHWRVAEELMQSLRGRGKDLSLVKSLVFSSPPQQVIEVCRRIVRGTTA